MKNIFLFFLVSVACLVLISASPTQAELGIGIGIKASSLGMGLEITKSTIQKLNIRAGFSSYSYSLDGEMKKQKIEYVGDLNLSSWSVQADYHPWNGSFHVSLGIIGNGNEAEATITPINEQVVGGRTFTIEDQGSIDMFFDWEKMAPYFGLGWGNPVAKGRGLGFNFDVGAMFQNSPNVELTGVGM
ncbi:hypothetical protein H8D57_02060, partial [bacterium]|nr:hypothetical protein [bacterium]